MGQSARFLSPSTYPERPANPNKLCIEKSRRHKGRKGRVQPRAEFPAWHMWYAQIRSISVCGLPRIRDFYSSSARGKHYLCAG
jgi:hypothetical protein